jgi:hypothetical protein
MDVVWEMEAKLPVVHLRDAVIMNRDRNYSRSSSLGSSNATTNSNGCPYMWQMMYRRSIKCE